MQTIDEVKRHCRVAVAVSAVFAAAVSCAAEPVVKELFPWFEIGETVDAAKGKGLKRLQTMEAREGLRAHEQYLIVDAGMPTNDMAWVTLSVPDRKVLHVANSFLIGFFELIKHAREIRNELAALRAKSGATTPAPVEAGQPTSNAGATRYDSATHQYVKA